MSEKNIGSFISQLRKEKALKIQRRFKLFSLSFLFRHSNCYCGFNSYSKRQKRSHSYGG